MSARPLSFKELMELIYVVTWRTSKVFVRFKVNVATNVASILASIVTFFIIAKMIAPDAAKGYGDGGYFAYALIGMAFNFYATITLGDYLKTVRSTYWANWLEMIVSARMRLSEFFISVMTWSYVYATINIALYFVFGIFLFGAGIDFPAHWWLVAVFLLLSILSISGLGLISASMFNLADAREGFEPISYAISLLSGLVTGVYFPLSYLPQWLRLVGYALPHTYALEGLRQVIQNDAGIADPQIRFLVVVLALFSVILLPIGLWMFKAGLKKGERDGTLARWS